MNLEQLRAALKEKSGQIATLKTAAEAAGAPAEAYVTLKAALDELDAIDDKIKQLEAANLRIKDAATPADPLPATTVAAPAQKLTGTQKLAVVVQGMFEAKKTFGAAVPRNVLKSMEEMGYTPLANEFDAIQKAMISTSGGNGGFFMGDGFNREFIELLWPNTAFLRGTPMEVPMLEGVYRQTAGNAKPTAAYRAEAAAIAASTPTLRSVSMAAKMLSGLVAYSNQVGRWSLNQAENYISNSLSSVMGIEMDRNTLVGTGLSDAPLGILNAVGIFSAAATAGVAPTIATVDSDTKKLILQFQRFPVLRQRLAWLMEARVILYIANLRDGNGNYAYPTMQGDNPTFKGYPVLDSGQIPVNLGAGTNESIIALVSFGTVLHGLSKGLELAMSSEATVAGVSMFETDQSAIRATLEHDVDIQYTETVAKLTAVQYGA